MISPFIRAKKIHFVGVGGIGMSGIAEVLLNLGLTVSGSDTRQTPITDLLADRGAKIFIGHDARHIEGVDLVVVSSAVGENNAEVLTARGGGIPVIRRAEMLAELMRLKFGIAVAGAHGKTTTTSMIAMVLSGAGLDPTVVIGGKVINLGRSAIFGHGPFMLAEADESDGSFIKLSPAIAVVTNIDEEHLDYYQNLQNIKNEFVAFLNKVPFYGRAIVCADDEHLVSILPRLEKTPLLYGLNEHANLQAILHRKGGKNAFSIKLNGNLLGDVLLAIPGEHNVLNALAAVSVGLELGIAFETIALRLAEFAGVERRFEKKGEREGVLVFDDYAHHPTEIKATIETAKSAFPDRHLCVLFQPHRYTRTRDLFDRFVTAFEGCSEVVILPIYAANEKEIAGINSEFLVQAILAKGQRCYYARHHDEAVEIARKMCKEGTLLLTLGAGDVWKAGVSFLEKN